MAVESRFEVGFKGEQSNAFPGLVIDDNNVVWLIKPDHTRVQVGEGGGGCEYFSCDTGAGNATVEAPNGIQILSPQTVLSAIAVDEGNSTVRTQAATPDHVPVAAVQVNYNDGSSAGGASVAANDPTGAQRAALYVTAGDAGEAELSATTSVTMFAANGEGGDSARVLLSSVDGDGGTMQVTADRLSFDASVTPVVRPTLDPATATAQQVAQALVDLGLAVEP